MPQSSASKGATPASDSAAGNPAQLLGRLPWLAALFLRAFFLRDFFAMSWLLFLARIRTPMVDGRARLARDGSMI